MNSSGDSKVPQKPSSNSMLSLWLPRHIPPTRNQLKGAHWSVYHQEMVRAADAIEGMLRIEAVLQSDSSYVADGLRTGTDTTSRNFKTCLSMLVSYRQTHGIYSKGESPPKRFTRRKKKGH